jgi:tRNA threonylcarbamoyladenosine modification (KEOPS) complex  Pcc1 subunit
MMKINLAIDFTDDAYAIRVLESVSPDNMPLPPGLEIEMTRSGRTLSCVIESTRGLDSLRATLEDLTSAIDLTLRTHEAID